MYQTLKNDESGVELAIPITLKEFLDTGLELDASFNLDDESNEHLITDEGILRVVAKVFFNSEKAKVQIGVGLEILDFRREDIDPDNADDWMDLIEPGHLEIWREKGWSDAALGITIRTLAQSRLPDLDNIIEKEAQPFAQKANRQAKASKVRFVGMCDNPTCLARDICAFYPDESCEETKRRVGIGGASKTELHA